LSQPLCQEITQNRPHVICHKASKYLHIALKFGVAARCHE